MNIPGFTAESAIFQNGDYRAAVTHEFVAQTVKAQLNCIGCTDFCTQECSTLDTHSRGRCFFACRFKCCRGIRE